jgi:hypothetical protein
VSAPTIAVVVNNYNLEPYLEAALASVAAQSDPPDEFVVVDDGSTDGSRALLERWTGPAEIVLQDNGGQAAALNTGFRHVRSDVVIFLDADDVLLPSAVGSVRRAWRPGMAKAHWPMRVIDGVGEPTGKIVPATRLLEGDLSELLLTDGPSAVVLTSPPTSGNAWARALLDGVMPMAEDQWRPWPDTFLLTVAPLLGEVGAHHEPLAGYRVHGENSSLGGDEKERLARAIGYVRDSGELLRRLRPDRVTASDVERWVTSSWAGRGLALHELIDAAVPPGRSFVLLDDWQTGWTEVSGRKVVRPWDEGAASVEHVAIPWWNPSAADADGPRNAGGVVTISDGR